MSITPHSYRLGSWQEDYFVQLSPFDWSLREQARPHERRAMTDRYEESLDALAKGAAP